MCLAIVGKVIEFTENDKMKVDIFGNISEIYKILVPDVKINDHVLVHAGFAINYLDEEEAKKTQEAWLEYIEILEKEQEKIDKN